MRIIILLFTLLLPTMAFSSPGYFDLRYLFPREQGTPPPGAISAADTVTRDTGWMLRVRRTEATVIRQEQTRREVLEEKRWNPGEKETWFRERTRQRRAANAPRITLLSLKANLPTWATATLNAAVEARVGKQWTVELPVTWSPWHIAREHAIRVFALQPEARRWLRTPGEGWFAGAHVHVAWFNVRWKRDRYQGAGRPLLGAGVSLGYALPLGGRWGAEFAAGAGYASIQYDTYYNIANGSRVSTRTRDYRGVTKARIAIVWKFKI